MHKLKQSTRALLIIDMINDFQFEHGDQLLQHTYEILQPLLQLKQKAKAANIPTIYINDHYNLWQANFKKITDQCRNRDNKEIIDQIEPTDEDFFLIKPKHSAFFGTSLNTLLAHLKVKELILTGIAGNICVLFTANDAYMREFTLYCPQNCIASADIQDNKYAITMMKNVLKADIRNSEMIQLDNRY
ncbi:isochorismatase family cysteine hydrolase [Bacillus massiliigorillae]|uniref:isochorismatase family cysteine hydrolase n=1 Tax=Bacillus massiliigorillae TaxID=1243664 RepID=UPI0003A93BE4|nr:isochorismatase family cysteine hydrolase [Bacillus massiliigorillae]